MIKKLLFDNVVELLKIPENTIYFVIRHRYLGSFGEHERSVRLAPGTVDSNSRAFVIIEYFT